MRFYPLPIPVYQLPVFLCVALAITLLLAACGPSHRPASALSEQDRTVLADYDKMRAGLASDDARKVKAAGADLIACLKKGSATPASNRLIDQTQAVVNAKALDTMRESFRFLSESLIPLAAGVDGYYILTCPPGFQGDWIQQTPQADNPYFGQVMRNFGAVKK